MTKGFVSSAAVAGMLFAAANLTHAETLTFGQNAPSHVLAEDIAVTRISIRIEGMHVGGFADYCWAAFRTAAPQYYIKIGRGGFTELICFNYVRTRDADKIEGAMPVVWQQEVDLRNTPIYMPAKTIIMCNSLGAQRSDRPAGSLPGICTIEYERFAPGQPRYRILRLPYLDQTFDARHPLVPSHFTAWDEKRPLRIKSAVVYQGNNFHRSSMKMCLTRLDRKMAVKEEHCFPASDEQSPGQVAVNWTIPITDYVSLTCKYPPGDTKSSGDCAAFLVVEVPPDLEVSAENAFRDYGTFPRTLARQWCERTAYTFKTETIHNPQFCDGAEPCSIEARIATCRKAFADSVFPRASCFATKSCWTTGKPPVGARSIQRTADAEVRHRRN